MTWVYILSDPPSGGIGGWDMGELTRPTFFPFTSFESPSRLGPLSTASTSECKRELLWLASVPSKLASLRSRLLSLPDPPPRLRLPSTSRCLNFLNGFKRVFPKPMSVRCGVCDSNVMRWQAAEPVVPMPHLVTSAQPACIRKMPGQDSSTMRLDTPALLNVV